MARELLWRGYPTDLRATCFARFWSTTPPDAVSLPGDDIAPITVWGDRLGSNPATDGPVPQNRTIVVVRGELLRRYPTTIVSAVRGSVRSGAEPSFTPDPATPPARELFRFQLVPDITCVALDIDPAVLKSAAGDLEWFVAFTQRVEEPRFGLDVEASADGNPAELHQPLVAGVRRCRARHERPPRLHPGGRRLPSAAAGLERGRRAGRVRGPVAAQASLRAPSQGEGLPPVTAPGLP